MKELIQRITALLYDKKKRKIRNKVGYAVACVVVFITTYALILPAITMEKHVACGIPEHQHSEECYEERLVCGLDEYIPVSDEAGGIDVIAEDDSSGLDVIEDSEPVQGHVHTEACYEKVLVCGMEPHTHSAACYKKQDSSVAENTVDEGPAPQENGSVEGDYIEENESGDELVYEEGAAEDLTDEYLSSGQEDIPASENNGAQDVSEGEDLSSGQEDISAAGNNGAQDVSEGEDLSSGQEDISAAENDGVQDVSDGAAAASGDVRDGSVSGQEETGESLTGPVDAPAENGVQEDGDSQASGDEASGQPVEDTDQSAVDAAPADSGEPSEDQSSEPENSIVYLDDESSDGGQAAGGTDQGTGEDAGTDVGGDTGADSETGTIPGETTADGGQTAGTDASKDGAASENTEGENEVPEQGAEDGSTIQESGAEGQQAQAEDPSQGSVSLADYLTGATAVYYSRTAGNDGEDEWKPVENDTVLMPSDKIRVYLAYQLPGGLLNGTDSRARYMLPEQLWLSGSRVDRINHFENGIASGTEDETEKASLLGAEAVEGTRRPDEQRSGQTEFISAIVNIENVQDAEGRLSGQELVFRFVPYTVEKNSDVFDAEGALSSKGQEVNGYFTIDYMVNEILSGIAADGGASSDQAAEQVREAVIVFASVNTESGQREISAKLKISETAAEADPEEQDSKTAEEDPESAEGENAQADPESEEGENAQTDPESEEGEEAQTDSESEEGEGVQTDPESAEGETAQKDPESADEETEDKDADEENEGGEITADASDGSDSAAEAAGGLSDQLPDMPAQNFEQTIRVKTGGTGSGNAVSDFFKNLFGFFTGNGGADSDDAGEALSSEADLTVHVDADEGTFPAGTTMTVKAVSGRDLNAVSEAISEAVDSETCGFQAVDITFRNAQGEEIEPKKPVRVTFSTDLISEAAQNEKIGQPVIVHVQDDGSAQALSSNAAAEGPARAAEERIAAGTGATVGLEQGSVTFEAGETAESEQTGNNIGEGGTADPDQNGNGSQDGSAVESGQNGDHTGSDVSDDSRQSGDVVEESEPEDKAETQTNEEEEADGITVDADSFSIYAIVYTVDFFWEVNGKTYEFSLPGGGYVPFETLMEILGVADGNPKVQAADADDAEADEDQTQAALMLTGIEASEKTKELVRDVVNVTFSSPELMWVGKAGEDTTVGALKEANSLEVQYSADLTEEQISQINAQTVKAGEWILISLLPFESEETLTVTMSTGETFTVKVTDAAYTVTKIKDLDGKSVFLVNEGNENALQSSKQSDRFLKAVKVSVDPNNNTLTSDDSLTKWTFVKDGDGYNISSPEGYLKIDNQNGLSVTNTKQKLIIEQKTDGRIRIRNNDNYAVNNRGSTTSWGYQAYQNGGLDNKDEWFTLFELDDSGSGSGTTTNTGTTFGTPATVHYGYMENGVFYEFDEPPYPTDTSTGDGWAYLIYNFQGTDENGFSFTYNYKGTYYSKQEAQNPTSKTSVIPLLRYNNNAWKYYEASKGTSGDALRNNNNWKNIENNSHIYLVYEKPTISNGGTPTLSQNTPNPDSPDILKQSEENGDGTNTLSLSITGSTADMEVEKLADVIVVLDLSSSMQNNIHNNDSTGSGYAKNENSRYYQAKKAVITLANNLYQKNADSGKNLIRMGLVTFAGNAHVRQELTEDKVTFLDQVDAIERYEGKGTNWEHAIKLANEMSVDPGRATYVIFVTDGEPTVSQTRYSISNENLRNYMFVPGNTGGNIPNQYGPHSQHADYYNPFHFYLATATFGMTNAHDPESIQDGYGKTLTGDYMYNHAAYDDAKSIVDHNKNFYVIAISSEVGTEALANLIDAAGVPQSHGIPATNQTALTNAFNQIESEITGVLGQGDIKMTDGITDLTNTVSKTDLVGVGDEFTYWKSIAPEQWSTWSSEEKTAYMKGVEYATQTSSDPVEYSTWNDACKAAYQKGKAVDFTKWTSREADGCAPAVYNKNSGAVEWNMGSSFMLEAGVTYKVSFICWPSQKAYDYLAKCRNDESFYDDTLTESERGQILRTGSPGNYSYTLKTNKDGANTTYRSATKTGNVVTTTGEPQTLLFGSVPDLNLAEQKIYIHKDWENSLDNRRSERVRLGVIGDGNENDLFAVITVKSDPNPNLDWRGSAFISTGLMKVEDGKMIVFETGHDFTITEKVEEGPSYHWELTTDTYRPMVITDSGHGYNVPTTVILKKVESTENYHYQIGGKYYAIVTDSDNALNAINHRRSNLNLTKDVYDKDGTTVINDKHPDELFEFTIKVTDPTLETVSEQDIWFSVQDADGNVVAVETTAPYKETKSVSNAVYNAETHTYTYEDGGKTYTLPAADDGTGFVAYTGFYATGNGSSFTVSMKPTWNLRFTNLPTGTTYSITESNKIGYECFGADLLPEASSFSYSSGTRTAAGIIEKPNMQYTVRYKNKYTLLNIDVFKTDNTVNSNNYLDGAVFKLQIATGNGNWTTVSNSQVHELDQEGTFTVPASGITLTGLVDGKYRLQEIIPPEGYIITNNQPVVFTVTGGIITSTDGTITEVGYTAATARSNVKFAIPNTPGAVLPHTGGPGTRIFMVLGGLFLSLGGLLLIKRHRLI